MEKKSNSRPVDACEKFFKAFRPIRGNPNHHPAPNPSSASASNIVKTHHHHNPPKHPKPNIVASEVVPLKSDYSTPQKNGGKVNKNKMNANIQEDEFTKYIKHAWNKIRTPSSVGGGGGKNVYINASATATGGEDTGKDHFSDYINRAKKRMLRTMSSFVGGRNDSMK